MTADWMRDLRVAELMKAHGGELAMRAIGRRCSKPVEGTSPSGGVPNCTKDKGHDEPCECNVARDIQGKDD